MRIIFIMFVLGGCVTDMRARLEIFNYETGTGVVSYKSGGYPGVIAEKRANAEQIMERECKGPFEVVLMKSHDQYVGSSAMVVSNPYSPLPNASAFSSPEYRNYTILTFKCVQAEEITE